METVKRLMVSTSCNKNYSCYNTGFTELCKGKDIGLEDMIECLEKEPWRCHASMPFGGGCFCNCAIRVYLAKEARM